jgi:hypothetical protein
MVSVIHLRTLLQILDLPGNEFRDSLLKYAFIRDLKNGLKPFSATSTCFSRLH